MAQLQGMKAVITKLNAEILKIEARSMKGLIEASIIIRRDMEKTPPLVPVGETGNLRASWFTSPIKVTGMPGLLIGFNANYAIFVHEMVDKEGKKINWNRPGSGPKFFEAALSRNAKLILQTIQKNAYIK